jgi:hypothetical protein
VVVRTSMERRASSRLLMTHLPVGPASMKAVRTFGTGISRRFCAPPNRAARARRCSMLIGMGCIGPGITGPEVLWPYCRPLAKKNLTVERLLDCCEGLYAEQGHPDWI